MKCQEENFYYITVPRVQKTFTQKYLCKLSPHRQLNKTVYWQLGLFMVNNLSHKSFSMNSWDYKPKFRTFNQWRNEGSKAKGWVPVCSLSYFVKEFVYFYAHIAREQCLIIQNHASRWRKKNISVLRSLWVNPSHITCPAQMALMYLHPADDYNFVPRFVITNSASRPVSRFICPYLDN